MERILVSACLLGDPVRYNGAHKRSDDDILRRWILEERVVPICPEVAGGLSVPRLPAEIANGAGGAAVVDGNACVVDSEGNDVSAEFLAGARRALASARESHIRVAVLKEGSPSCGTAFTYDGTFSGTRVEHRGVTAALLEQSGIHVFSETQLAEAQALLLRLESRGTSIF